MIAFILSHNRPDSCPTLEMLDNFRYCGNYKIVVDVDDKYLDKYLENYSKDKLLLFDKNEWLYKEDTAYSKETLIKASPFYARIMIDEYARVNNIGDYLVLDDDIINLKIRCPIDNSLKTLEIKDFNKLLDSLFEFLNENNLYGLSFAHSGMFIGGVDSFDKVINKRVGSNIFLFNSNRQLTWKTIFYDDFNTCLSNSQFGKLLFPIPYIQIHAEDQGSQSDKVKNNGMGEAYATTKQFTRSFYSVMLFPSSCIIKSVGKSENNWWPSLKLDNQFQKIISSRFKR